MGTSTIDKVQRKNMLAFLQGAEAHVRELDIKSPLFPTLDSEKWRMRIRLCRDDCKSVGITLFHGTQRDAPRSTDGDLIFHSIRDLNTEAIDRLILEAIECFQRWGAVDVADQILGGNLEFTKLVEED